MKPFFTPTHTLWWNSMNIYKAYNGTHPFCNACTCVYTYVRRHPVQWVRQQVLVSVKKWLAFVRWARETERELERLAERSRAREEEREQCPVQKAMHVITPSHNS